MSFCRHYWTFLRLSRLDFIASQYFIVEPCPDVLAVQIQSCDALVQFIFSDSGATAGLDASRYALCWFYDPAVKVLSV
jgi:hypothetical protein